MAVPITPDPHVPRRAWASLVTNPAYLAGLLVLYRTLRAVSSYPLVVMVTDTLPESSRRVIRAAGLTMIDVPHLTPAAGRHPGFDPSFVRLNDAWTKLRVFGLTQYDRLILIDSDMIFLRAMDELFDLQLPGKDWIGAAPACVCNPFKLAHYPEDWVPANCSLSKQSRHMTLATAAIPSPDAPRTSHLLNSGLVVLSPSAETMDSLLHHLDSSPTIAQAKFADQDVIAETFHGRWHPLPWWCNALKTERAVHPDLWSDTEARLVHYILDKPWSKRPPATPRQASLDEFSLPSALVDLVRNSPPQSSLTSYDEVHAWWWVVYDQLLAEMQREGESSGWREMASCIDT